MAILYDTDWGDVLLRASRRVARVEAWLAARADVRAFLMVNVLLPYGMALVMDGWVLLSPAYSPAKTWYWVFMVLVLFNANLVQLFTLHRLRTACIIALLLNGLACWGGNPGVFVGIHMMHFAEHSFVWWMTGSSS